MSSPAQTLTGTLGANYNVTETLVYGATSGSNYAKNPIAPSISYVNGTSATANAINLHYEAANDPVTLTPSSTQTFTLSSLTDGLGRNFSLAGGVRYLVIYVTARTAGDYLTFTPAAVHGWTALLSGTSPQIVIWDVFVVGVAQTDGYAITASSNDSFTITNAGSHNITFQIGIAGCNS